jgi:hypothetical protein
MPLMNSYIDMSRNQEWKVVNMESNIQQMFDKLQAHFFSTWIKQKITVKWDTMGVISDDSCFKIFEPQKQVLVTSSAMVHPRVNLVSVLLHILIHFYLSTCSAGAIKINAHDENFRRIMLFMNEKMQTKISVSGIAQTSEEISRLSPPQTFHKFIFSPEETEYAQQWYQCTGICTSYEPFHGTVRCTTIPDESHTFFKGHDEDCGGQFFRIFEMSRVNPETDHTEKVYVRNTHYMFPTPRAAGRSLNNQPVRELFDLTDDTETAQIQNLCDVINLDESQYAQEEECNSSLVDKIIKQPFSVFSKCAFCGKVIGIFRLADHFDKCRGFQQKVVFKRK